MSLALIVAHLKFSLQISSMPDIFYMTNNLAATLNVLTVSRMQMMSGGLTLR